ncbi:hypothetical protein UFOVP836_57 [uncultured Caudovirales phage]|uniref:Uncharacterized protein n=1 Tax=uncultured Caudovirales phage TaxID=2100421 RepID=A0A6J5PC14_9CAUD|nr:hypothetical protein UFOVP836_57 [uncultured Caudovirales phage]
MQGNTLEQLERIANTLDDMREDVSGLTTSQAVQTSDIKHIVEHLARLNGRVGKSEDRLSSLENDRAEARGAWKFIALISSIPASIIGAGAMWWANHEGK